MKQDPHFVATCDLCGEAILAEDKYYEMPDGFVVCAECLEDWASGYKKIAQPD